MRGGCIPGDPGVLACSALEMVISGETQLVGLGYGLTGPSAPRMAPRSLQGRIHGVPRQPVPEPSPAAEL